MQSPDEFPLDFAGIESTPPITASKTREQRELADLVAAVIAVENTRPIRPHSDSLKKIHSAIAGNQTLSFTNRFLILSGWIAAAAVLLFTLLMPDSLIPNAAQRNIITQVPQARNSPQIAPKIEAAPAPPLPTPTKPARHSKHSELVTAPSVHPVFVPQSDDAHRKLVQEVEVLRDQVKILAGRDKERLVVRGGISWPVIMKLTAPGSDPDAAIIRDPLLSALLDSQKTQAPAPENSTPQSNPEDLVLGSQSSNEPFVAANQEAVASAVPVFYDPARDIGQIYLSDVEAPSDGKQYNLWAKIGDTNQYSALGSLPTNILKDEVLTFRANSTNINASGSTSTGVIPTGFAITLDAINAAIPPSAANTYLVSPPSSERK